MFHQLLLELLVLGIAAPVAAAASMRLRFSPIAGYLLAGILIGPTSLNLLPESESIRLLGEAGVALLMFVVGLEFSWPTLVASRGLVFGRGGLQVFAGAGIGALLGSSIGVGVWAGLLIGAALSMSSTAVVHKQLLDQEESVTPHGIAATGFLLFHDFAALPLLAMLAALDAREAPSSVISTVASLGVSTAAFLLVALLARRTVGHFLSWCARSRYSEVFLLATICLLLGSALTAQRIGLSLPLAAFIVGMIIGESDFRHQLAEELRPFRDLLLALFFLTIGMAIDWRVVWAEPLVALGAFGFLVVFSRRTLLPDSGSRLRLSSR